MGGPFRPVASVARCVALFLPGAENSGRFAGAAVGIYTVTAF